MKFHSSSSSALLFLRRGKLRRIGRAWTGARVQFVSRKPPTASSATARPTNPSLKAAAPANGLPRLPTPSSSLEAMT